MKEPIEASEKDIRLAAETAQKLAAYAENECKRKSLWESHQALDELAALHQEMGGYASRSSWPDGNGGYSEQLCIKFD